MFTKFKTQKRVVFLDANQQAPLEYQKGQKLQIILSPALYWVKKMSLPVKNLRDVKKLLPSLFEEVLPEGVYSYEAYKVGDEYLLFAYEDKKILELLAKKKIPLHDVAGVYFAQMECDEQQQALEVNEKEVLLQREGVFIITPKEWVENAKPLALEQKQCHSKPLVLQQYGHIVDRGSLYKIAAILLVLIFLVGVEIFLSKQKITQIQQAQQKLHTKYKLHATMMQNRSILEKYRDIYQTQVRLRDVIAYFLKLKLHNTQRLELLSYSNKQLRVALSGMSEHELQKALGGLKKKSYHYTTHTGKKNTIVEVRL